MALPSTVYKVTLHLSDIDHGVYEAIQTTAAKHPSETEERLVARLLAFAIFFEPELTFTKGLCATDEPDIWAKEPDGRVKLWVEVGLPDAERIIKASRHSGRVVLLACGRSLTSWDQQHLPKLMMIKNLTVASVEPSFISTLVTDLERVINWSITITEGNLYLAVGTETYETSIQVKVGTL